MTDLIGRLLLVVALCCAAPAALTKPMTYRIDFDASDIASGASGPSGTGSFSYDDAAQAMTDLVWDFGPGKTGGVTNFGLALILEPSIGLSMGAKLFTEIFDKPADSPYIGSAVDLSVITFGISPFPWGAYTCGGLDAKNFCGISNAVSSSVTYRFTEFGSSTLVVDRGFITTELVSSAIPEPETWMLVGGGLAGFAVRSRRRLAVQRA